MRTNTTMRSLMVWCLMVLMVVGLVPSSVSADDGRDGVGWIVIEGGLTESPNPLAWLVGDDPDKTLLGKIAAFDDAAQRHDVQALVVHLKDLQVNRSQLESLGEAVERVRKAGKPVHVYATNYGPGELLFGCFADEIIMQPGGLVQFPGLYAEEMFLADTLGLIGIKADMLQVGDYKGASEQFGRNSPSPEWSENIDKLLDDIWAQMTERIMIGRGFSKRELNKVLKKSWVMTSEQAIDAGLIDSAVDILDFRSEIRDLYDGAVIITDLGASTDGFEFSQDNFLSIYFKMLSGGPKHKVKRETIAVIHIDGPIMDGKSSEGSLFGGKTVGDRTIRKALKRIEDEDLVKGLVVRINSPGGSAIASEMIWQGLRRVAEEKPVYVSVGSMAASGGYYIAVGGDKIFVDPTSIVGSIGVVSGKMVMSDLYDKIDLGVTARARGPMASMMSTVEPFDETQREMMHGWMVDVYDLFADHVEAARGKRVDMSKIAEGRLFTGRQSIENGMADGLADFGGTIDLLADDVGLVDGSYDVMTFPGPKSMDEMMEDMFGGFVRSPSVGADALAGRISTAALAATVREVVGETAWPQVRDTLNGLMILRDEPVVLISPRVIVVH